MGLDTSHDCWHGAYSAFARWRTEIAKAAGYPAKTPDGYGYWSDEMEALYRANPRILKGRWGRKMPRDPILFLLCHSDCDGIIRAKHAPLLADALEALLPKLNGDWGGHIGLIREKTEQFIRGLRKAAAAGEDVEFH